MTAIAFERLSHAVVVFAASKKIHATEDKIGAPTEIRSASHKTFASSS
jgi:hypothetical protein